MPKSEIFRPLGSGLFVPPGSGPPGEYEETIITQSRGNLAITEDLAQALFPLAPTGSEWSVEHEEDWDIATLDDGGWTWYNASQTSVQDQTGVPGGAGRVMQHAYDEDAESGGGYNCGRNIGGDRKQIYVGQYIRFSSNFVGHSSGVNKITFIRTTRPSGDSLLWFEGYGSGSNPLRDSIVPQLFECGTNRYTNDDSVFVRGDWVLYELLFELGDNPSANNGRFRTWMNGELSLDHSICTPDSDTYRVELLNLSGMLGGAGPTNITEDQWIWRGPVLIMVRD